MRPVNNAKYFQNVLTTNLKGKKIEKITPPQDSIKISNTSKAFAKLDKFLNLGRPDRLDIDDLNEAEKKEFLKMLSYLLKRGIIGYEVLEVNGKPEKHYIVNQIGNERIYGAKLFKKKGYYKD